MVSFASLGSALLSLSSSSAERVPSTQRGSAEPPAGARERGAARSGGRHGAALPRCARTAGRKPATGGGSPRLSGLRRSARDGGDLAAPRPLSLPDLISETGRAATSPGKATVGEGGPFKKVPNPSPENKEGGRGRGDRPGSGRSVWAGRGRLGATSGADCAETPGPDSGPEAPAPPPPRPAAQGSRGPFKSARPRPPPLGWIRIPGRRGGDGAEAEEAPGSAEARAAPPCGGPARLRPRRHDAPRGRGMSQ